MNNSEPLFTFGIAVCLIVGLVIVIPFLRGKSDIPTAWNCLLLGIILFTGLGSIEVKYVSSFSFEQLNWFQPTAKEVQWYIWASIAFIATLIISYFFNAPAKRFAQRRLRKWPEFNFPVAFFVLGACFAIIVVSFVVGRIVFIGPAFFKLGNKAAVFATVFSFMLWNRNRVNVTWLLLFLGVLLTAIIYCMLVSPGRRLVMSVFLGPILCIYWTEVRNWKPAKILISMALAGFVMVSVSAVYSKLRWYNVAAGEKRSVQGLVSQMKDLRSKGDYFSALNRGRITYFGQQNAHFALLTERYIAQGAVRPSPLNTLQFILSYPIPRKIWPNKPEVIGLTIVRDVAHIPGTNWGLGIAGQGAYEGGIPALMLYAVLLALFVRIFDEPLKLQPNNPFLISMHAAALPHIVGITRGDMGIMVIESLECVLFAVLLGFVCRAIFGNRQMAPTRPAAALWQSRYSSG